MHKEVQDTFRAVQEKAAPWHKMGSDEGELRVLRIYCAAIESLLRDMARKIDQLEKKVDAVG